MDAKTEIPSRDALVSFDGLGPLGIAYSRVHLRRLIANGKFPTPIQPSPNRVAWRRAEILDWIETRPRVEYIGPGVRAKLPDMAARPQPLTTSKPIPAATSAKSRTRRRRRATR